VDIYRGGQNSYFSTILNNILNQRHDNPKTNFFQSRLFFIPVYFVPIDCWCMLLLGQPALLSLRAFLAACLLCFTQANKDVLFCSKFKTILIIAQYSQSPPNLARVG